MNSIPNGTTLSARDQLLIAAVNLAAVLNEVNYRLSVTDPTVESEYADGAHDIGRAILCISLGEPYEGYAYKLIAGMIKVPEPTHPEVERKDPLKT
jgi:hypothetical protein